MNQFSFPSIVSIRGLIIPILSPKRIHTRLEVRTFIVQDRITPTFPHVSVQRELMEIQFRKLWVCFLDHFRVSPIFVTRWQTTTCHFDNFDFAAVASFWVANGDFVNKTYVITDRDSHCDVTLGHNNRILHASQSETHCLYWPYIVGYTVSRHVINPLMFIVVYRQYN